MFFLVFISLGLVSLLQGQTKAMDESGKVCIDDRAALLALDQNAFDQDMFGGWRAISYRKGCEEAAAGLIQDYRLAHPDAKQDILYWHEGQVRADIGQYDQAIALFKHSYDSRSQKAWTYYVKATIAFLEHDREALEQNYEQMRALPRPDNWSEMSDAFKQKFGTSIRWPMNIGVVEGLCECFDKPYSEAYHSCSKQSFKITKPDPKNPG